MTSSNRRTSCIGIKATNITSQLGELSLNGTNREGHRRNESWEFCVCPRWDPPSLKISSAHPVIAAIRQFHGTRSLETVLVRLSSGGKNPGSSWPYSHPGSLCAVALAPAAAAVVATGCRSAITAPAQGVSCGKKSFMFPCREFKAYVGAYVRLRFPRLCLQQNNFKN